jgi:hypothetical protein
VCWALSFYGKIDISLDLRSVLHSPFLDHIDYSGVKMKKRRVHMPRLSPAMVVACIALVISLGGTGYAAIKLPMNSVGTAQLKVNSVTSNKIRDFSLRSWDFKKGQLPRGPAGPPGPTGTIAPLSPREASVTVPANAPGNGLYASRAVQVKCQSGETAVAGGTSWSSDVNSEEMSTVYSRPLIQNGQPVGWRARGATDLNTDRVFNVEVLCMKK